MGILVPTLQAAQQPINRDSKIDIPRDEFYRLPKKLRPSVSKINKAVTNDQDLYLVIKQLMLVGGSTEEKVTWQRKKYPPNSYAARIVCSGGAAGQDSQIWASRSSSVNTYAGAFGNFVEQLDTKRMLRSAAITIVVFGFLRYMNSRHTASLRK